MIKQQNKFTLSFILLAGWLGLQAPAQDKPVPPLAEKIPKILTIHNHSRTDDYYWLNQRSNPKTVEYLLAENSYTEAMTKHLVPLQEKLYAEMINRIKQTDASLPYLQRGYWYYQRFEAGLNYPLLCRKHKALTAKEELMLDCNKLAEGKRFFNLGGRAVSPDNQILAYSVDLVSRRQYHLRFRNLKTGKSLPDEISPIGGEMVWASDNRTVFYTVIDDTLRAFKVQRHVLGQDSRQDVVVYEEKDSTFSVSIRKSRSEKYVLIGCKSTLSSEYWLIDTTQPTRPAWVFQPRQRDMVYGINHYDGIFRILTNYQAKNFQIMTASENKTSLADWQKLVEHRPDVLVNDFSEFKTFLLIEEQAMGLSQLRVIPQGEKEGYLVPSTEQDYSISAGQNPDPTATTFRYNYSSLTTPESTFEFNTQTRQSRLLKQEEVLGDFKPGRYTSERILARAHDGALIPISLVYERGIDPKGKNPLLLYGYGSYGATMDPNFRSSVLSLLNRGFIYAIAHIRGGQELGRYWYEEGKLLKKINTFTDFISCAEHLVRYGYTTPAKLAAQGGSAGGLLMGAVINLQPDLFKAVIAEVPFVDVITTMLDESIPLTTSEYDEWGNPRQADFYDYMLSYSPYDNVRPKYYPALLVTTGFHDSQVQYWEPAKWVAKLRVTKLDNNALLLKTNMAAGHGGPSGRYSRLKEVAFEYAFLLDQLGIEQ